jgi:hypothetical protein
VAIVFSVEGVSKGLKTTRLSVGVIVSTYLQRFTCVAVMISFERKHEVICM